MGLWMNSLREHQQKTFVMLAYFGAAVKGWDVGLCESVKKEKFVMKIFL